jgi:hypothetical protein
MANWAILRQSFQRTVASQGKSVIVDRLGPVTVVSLNRPDKRNCVNPETAGLLLKAFEDFEKDSSAHVAILRGNGGTFCAGYDLSVVAAGAAPSFVPLDAGPGPMGPSRLALSKPVIAAIDGHAVAGGLELALWCDLRVADESAVMGVFCRRFGVPLIDGGTVRLPALIGMSRAMDLILTGGRPGQIVCACVCVLYVYCLSVCVCVCVCVCVSICLSVCLSVFLCLGLRVSHLPHRPRSPHKLTPTQDGLWMPRKHSAWDSSTAWCRVARCGRRLRVVGIHVCACLRKQNDG